MKEIFLIKFAERLKTRMTALNIQQNELAEMIGVEPSAVSNWLNGENGARAKTLRRLGEALHCDPAWLAGVGSVETISTVQQTHSGEGGKLQDGAEIYGVETRHCITTKSKVAADIVNHFFEFLNRTGDDPALLHLVKLEVEKYFGLERWEPKFEQQGKAMVKVDPRQKGRATHAAVTEHGEERKK